MTTELSDRAVEQMALEWANSVRAEDGHEPLVQLVPGVKNDCECCPLAETINGYVDGDSYELDSDIETAYFQPLPQFVKEFVERFDSGKYPHLIRSANENI